MSVGDLKKVGNFTAVLVAAGLVVGAGNLAHASFDDGVKAYETRNYEEAIKQWLPLARNNDTAAMRNLGHMYRRGLGVAADPKQAVYWYRRAAERGFERAQANLASMYLKGEGVKKDAQKATEWFIVAARNGHVISQYNLGLIYENGLAGPKDQAKAMAWYNLAAKAGHPKALEKLSLLIVESPTLELGSTVESESKSSATEDTQAPAMPAGQTVRNAETSTTAPTATAAVAVKASAENSKEPSTVQASQAAGTAERNVEMRPIAEQRQTEVITAKSAEATAGKSADTPSKQMNEAPKAPAPAASQPAASNIAVAAPAAQTRNETTAAETTAASEPETVTATAAKEVNTKQTDNGQSAAQTAKSETAVNPSRGTSSNGVSILSVRERAERQLAGLREKVEARDASPAVQEALPSTKIEHVTPSSPAEQAPVVSTAAVVSEKTTTGKAAATGETGEKKKPVSLFATLQSLFKSDDKVEKSAADQPQSAAAGNENQAARSTPTAKTVDEAVAVRQPAAAEPAAALTKERDANSDTGSTTGPVTDSPMPSDTAAADAVATSSISTVAAAPVTAAVPSNQQKVATATAAAPVEKPVEPIFDSGAISGSGLTLDERLEMASLSFELQDYHQALVVWMPLAKAGHPGAQYHIGDLFRQGLAVPVNRQRAHFWMSKATRGGSALAAEALIQLERTMTEMEIRQARRIQ